MTQKTKEELKQAVEQALVAVRESLVGHNGNIELVDVIPEQGVAIVRLQGACVGCPMADMTLKMGVESAVTKAVPEIKEVRRADDE